MPPLHDTVATIGRRGSNALRRSIRPTVRPASRASASNTYAYTTAHVLRFHASRSNGVGIAHGVTGPPLSLDTDPRQYSPRCLSSSPSSPPSNLDITTNLTKSEGDTDNKSIFSKMWDKYSFGGQKKRIVLGERLFRSAQHRANDPRWFQEARIPYEFRPRHALITMHVWFLHKRLLADRVDSHLALLVQEELFDILWNDTRARIRAEGVNELTVNKHLKDAQQLTFLHCCHYDHAFQEFAGDDKKRFEEIAGILWTYVLDKDDDVYDDQLERLVTYVEYQHVNLLQGVPDAHFWEGRIPWGGIPEFKSMKDNKGKPLEEVGEVPGLEVPPEPWVKTLTDAGDKYYWNTETNETAWKAPI